MLALVFVGLWVIYGVPLQNMMYDPSFYYGHLTSPVIDGDLNFANQGAPPELTTLRTSTGLVASLWSVGPAIAWSPFFLLAHGLTLTAHTFGISAPASGYTAIYLTLCALGSAFWGWIGVVSCYCLSRSVAGTGPALLTALAVWLASPLFFFMYRIPLYAHAPTVAAIGALLCVWRYVQRDPHSLWPWLLLGMLVGVATLMRWQNGLFAVLVPFACVATTSGERPRAWRIALLRLVVAAGGALVAFAPQMVVWWRLYGSPLVVPQGDGFFHWLQPNLALLLFGSNRGLFVWQPIAGIGLAGLFVFAWQRPWLGGPLLLVALLETYLNSVVSDWWGGGGYGPRRFDWAIPLVALGMTLLAGRVWRVRWWRNTMYWAVALCMVYQLALAQAFYYRVLPTGTPFPIDSYDTGQPLPATFFTDILSETVQHPASLVAVHPALWSSAPPTWLGLWRSIAGAPIDDQLVASCVATLVGSVLAYLGWRWLPTLCTARNRRYKLARLASLGIALVTAVAALTFAIVGR